MNEQPPIGPNQIGDGGGVDSGKVSRARGIPVPRTESALEARVPAGAAWSSVAAGDTSPQMMSELPPGVSRDRLMWMTIERSATGIAIVDLDGRWLRVNPALCNITGYTEGELVGSRFQDITHPDDLPEELSKLVLLVAGRIREYVMDKRIRNSAGDLVWVRASVALMDTVDQSAAYLIAQIEDIDRRRPAAEVADDILSLTGHELRTPLTSILGYADILHERWDGVPEATRAEALSVIATEARRLTAVVGDILTLSEIRRGQLVVTPTIVNVRELITTVKDGWPSLYLDLRRSSHVSVWADRERLRTILEKLIENAFRFGAPPVLLRVSLDKSWVIFCVEDCGQEYLSNSRLVCSTSLLRVTPAQPGHSAAWAQDSP